MPAPLPAPKIIAISADDFVKSLRELIQRDESCLSIAEVDAVRIEVSGCVNLAADDLPSGLTIERIYFRDAVNMDGCIFGGDVTFRSCAFYQSISLIKAVFRSGISFIDCNCGTADTDLDRTKIVLDDCKIRGNVTFFCTTVYGCVSARRLRLSGNLEFTGCRFEGKSSSGVAPLDLSNGKIKGSVILETGSPALTFAPTIAAALGYSPSTQGTLLRRSSFIDRSDDGASFNLRGARISESVELAYARFIGDVNLQSIKCWRLSSWAGSFEYRFDGNLPWRADGGTNPRQQGYGGATINGALLLSGSDIGHVHFHGISISGEMVLIDGTSGQIRVEDAIYYDKQNNKIYIAPSQLGNFIMVRWHCRDFLSLHPVEITGRTNDWGVHGISIKSTIVDRSVSVWPGVQLQDLLQTFLQPKAVAPFRPKFYTLNKSGWLVEVESDPECRKLLNRWQRRLVLYGNITIDHCTIGDDLDLTGINVNEDRRVGDGHIDIIDSKVDGDVVFRSPIATLVDAQTTVPLSLLLAQRLAVDINDHAVPPRQNPDVAPFGERSDEPTSPFVGATCYAADMRGLQAINVDLTGLTVRQSSHLSSTHAPNVLLSRVHVRGTLATFARLSKPVADDIFKEIKGLTATSDGESDRRLQYDPLPDRMNWKRELLGICFGDRLSSIRQPDWHLEVGVTIPGSLNLQHAEIGELRISDYSFCDQLPGISATKNGIVLDHAQTSKLYVARCRSSDVASGHHNGFPVPVSLTELSVKSWFLEPSNDSGSLQEKDSYLRRETTIPSPYLDLLDNDPVFRMSSYLAIEKSLRDRGLTAEAREIFIAGNYRDVRTEREEEQPNVGDPRPRSRNWPKWKVWRRGDGRYRKSTFAEFLRTEDGRRDPLVVGLCAVGFVAILVAIAEVIINRSPDDIIGLLIAFFFLFALRGNIFRLRRPLREYVGFLLCLIWCGVTILVTYVVVVLLNLSSSAEVLLFSASVLGLVILLAIGVALRDAMRCSLDLLYWSLVDYGTSPVRLAGIIFFLMFISFAFVSGERKNFEPTLLAEILRSRTAASSSNSRDLDNTIMRGVTPRDQLSPFTTLSSASRGKLVRGPSWDENNAPTVESWTIGERIWMTLRFHVPLVGAIISEEWQPARKSLLIARWRPPEAHPGSAWWPRARDWYAVMLWMNWILWPLFLPFLIHKLLRER
jgi:hypothetical protein